VKQHVATPTIAAPAERVWRLLTDVEALAAWAPSIRPARLDDPSVGLAAHATGTVTAIARLTLRVVVTEYIDGRSWAWSLGGCRQPATMLRTRRALSRRDRRSRGCCAVPGDLPSRPTPARAPRHRHLTQDGRHRSSAARPAVSDPRPTTYRAAWRSVAGCGSAAELVRPLRISASPPATSRAPKARNPRSHGRGELTSSRT
jgi:hypothetical protein